MEFFPRFTQRLEIRELTLDDYASVHEYAKDPVVIRHMLWGPNSQQETLEYLHNAINNQFERPRSSYELAVVLRDSQSLIGGCGIYLSEHKNKVGEIGYCFNKNYWGKGYASEASRAMLDFGFNSLKLHRIYATCDPANIGSAKVLEKIGMKREGHLREHLWQRDRWRDSFLYAILEHEF